MAQAVNPSVVIRGDRFFVVLAVVSAIPGAYVASGFFNLSLTFAKPSDYLLFLLLAPSIEELIFRGWIQPELAHRGFGPWLSNGLTSVLFALLHAPMYGTLAVLWLLPSLALGYVRTATGKLWLCIAVHAWFNLCLWLVGLPA